MKFYTFLLFVLLCMHAQAQNPSVSFEKWISLKQAGAPLISPDGKYTVYAVTSTDWISNTYDSELWMSHNGEPPFQLTRTPKGSSSAARFTPDSKWVSFLADRGEKTQLYIISVNGGEAMQITKDEDGIGNYKWSPDGTRIAYTKADPDSKKDKTLRERYGGFATEGEEYKLSHLWLLKYNYDSVVLAGQVPCYTPTKDSLKTDSLHKIKGQDCVSLPVATRLTEGSFTVTGFNWSPDGKTIAFTHQPNSLILSSAHADIALVDVASKKITTLVANPTNDFFNTWSSDGKSFIYSTNLADSVANFYKNNHVFIYDMSTQKSREIMQDVDKESNIEDWNQKGVFYTRLQKMKRRLYQLDPVTDKSTLIPLSLDLVGGVSFDKKTDQIAVGGRGYASLDEIYYGRFNEPLQQLTALSAQIKDWNTPVNEVVEWKSKDGTLIEGVLLKPRNYNPAKKYPLLVVIHGGPTGIDFPEPTPTYVYPIMQWVEKGALVLRVNYRGSAGYGEKFRSLNVRNLGVGDMWDVMSGVDYLKQKGMVDTARMGCMGWSQGGYISAFLTTNTHVFKAISVGAGISNWITYYVSTDITPFTRQYLQSTPWNDMDIYRKTSPMTTINQASTPTLIQHGEFDRRVPISNAYELYRGLQDRGVPSRLVVYKGFGHGINKPKERLAAVWHNWQWFNHYVFGEKEGSIPTD